jgi:hypothetical protein
VTLNQYPESRTRPGFALKGGGRRSLDTAGGVAALTSKLAVPVTVQSVSPSSFVSVAV